MQFLRLVLAVAIVKRAYLVRLYAGAYAPAIFLERMIKMLQAYSLNVTVPTDSAVPFNNVSVKKGCTVNMNGVSSIELNKCGVYMVSVDSSAVAASTLQLFKNGIAQAQAQATGTTPSFVSLIQVPQNNSCCCCSEPTVIQVKNVGDASATLSDANIVVTKVC